jgi:ribosomal protein L35
MARRKKSHKGLAKRFKVTRNRKILGAKSGYHHKQVKKSSKRVRQARKGIQVRGRTRKRYLQMLAS